jgi:hypothetical protein
MASGGPARTRLLAFGGLLAVLIFGSLSACSSPVSQKHASADNCTPSSAKVTWGVPVQGKKVPVEAHLISFEDGVQVSTPISTNSDTDAHFSYAGDRSITDISSTPEVDWQASLLSRLRKKTGIVPSDFGSGAPVDSGDITPSTTIGKFVVVTEEKSLSVPFTISCAGEKALSGSVAAVANIGAYSTLTECGAIPDGTPQEIVSLMGPACTKE